MGKLTIYGASDDLAEFEGHASGEVGCYGKPITVLIGTGDETLGVYLEHTGSRGWVLGTFMPDGVDEDKWNPPPATLTTRHYSPLLTVELEAGTPVLCFLAGEAHEIA